MLSIAPVKGPEGFGYYSKMFRSDYYVNQNETPLPWLGQGAKAFGLAGTVDATALDNLFRGKSPDGSRPLVQNAGREDRLKICVLARRKVFRPYGRNHPPKIVPKSRAVS